jgi:hypothetical protein
MAVEAVLVIPVILLVVVSAIEVASVASVQFALMAAAREGARVAAVVPDPAEAVRAVRRDFPGLPEATVSVERPAIVGASATVTVALDKPLVTPLLGGVTIPLRARATMRVEA